MLWPACICPYAVYCYGHAIHYYGDLCSMMSSKIAARVVIAPVVLGWLMQACAFNARASM